MARIFSGAMKANLIQVNNTDIPIYLLEINHASLGQPVRLANNNCDVVSNGNTYIGCPFKVSFPNDSDGEVARARLEINNIGRSLVMWIEQTNGAENTEVTLSLIQESDPDTVEASIILEFGQINITPKIVSGTIGFDRLLNARSMNQTYNADDFKGLY